MARPSRTDLEPAPVDIRDFQPADYAALVEIDNASFPDDRSTVEEWRYEDDHWEASRYFKHRFVATDPGDGRVLGYGEVSHFPWNFHSDKYGTWVAVAPSAQGRGIGRALYARAIEELRARGAVLTRTWVKENMAASVGFARRRGFVEKLRNWESHLDLRAFDPSVFASRAGPPPGIAIAALASERARDPDCLPRIFDLINAVMPDVPMPDAYTPSSYEMWLADLNGPNAIPEAYFLARDGDRYVALSNLWKSDADPADVVQGLTGVLREYRGRGLAWALKLRTAGHAKSMGARRMRTWNNTENRGILAINDALGFVKQPAWVVMEKDLTSGGDG